MSSSGPPSVLTRCVLGRLLPVLCLPWLATVLAPIRFLFVIDGIWLVFIAQRRHKNRHIAAYHMTWSEVPFTNSPFWCTVFVVGPPSPWLCLRVPWLHGDGPRMSPNAHYNLFVSSLFHSLIPCCRLRPLSLDHGFFVCDSKSCTVTTSVVHVLPFPVPQVQPMQIGGTLITAYVSSLFWSTLSIAEYVLGTPSQPIRIKTPSFAKSLLPPQSSSSWILGTCQGSSLLQHTETMIPSSPFHSSASTCSYDAQPAQIQWGSSLIRGIWCNISRYSVPDRVSPADSREPRPAACT